MNLSAAEVTVVVALAVSILGAIVGWINGQGQAAKGLVETATTLIKPLREELAQARTEIADLRQQLGTQAKRILELQEQVAGLLVENEKLRVWVKGLCNQIKELGDKPLTLAEANCGAGRSCRDAKGSRA